MLDEKDSQPALGFGWYVLHQALQEFLRLSGILC